MTCGKVHLWAESYILQVDDNKLNGKYLYTQIQIVDKQSEILQIKKVIANVLL